jgi:hypothetical protein
MRKELALSENGQFVPFLTKEIIENFLKAPHTFSLQRFNSNSSQEDLITVFENILTGTKTKEATLISIVQPLAKEMLGFTDYTKQTKRISSDARAFRDLFFSAKTPVDLILVDLPQHFNFDAVKAQSDPNLIKAFDKRVREALIELRMSYHTLLNDVLEELKKTFKLPKTSNIKSVRDELKRLNGLEKYTIDAQCKAFIGRLVDPYGDDNQWLVSFCSFIARKPPEKWNDQDLDTAKYRIAELASRERDLRLLQFHHQDTTTVKPENYEAHLIRLVSSRDGELERVVMVDNIDQTRLQPVLKLIKDTINIDGYLSNDDERIAALSFVLRELLSGNNSVNEESNKILNPSEIKA